MFPRTELELILFENGKAELLNGLFVELSQMECVSSDAIQNELELLFWAGLILLITSAVALASVILTIARCPRR